MARMPERNATVLEVVDRFESCGEEPVLLDGFDDALVGTMRRFSPTAGHVHVPCYDYAICVAITMKMTGGTFEEALEFLEFNVLGACVGEETPAFLVRAGTD